MRRLAKMPHPERLRALLDYNPETGELKWKHRPDVLFANAKVAGCWNAKHAGRIAFPTIQGGYRRGYVDGKMALAHRIAYAIHHGISPAFEIDHINGNSLDNSAANLRPSDPLTNNRNKARPSNNTSGDIGVSCRNGRWRASITVDNHTRHLGYFDSRDEAVAARRTAQAEIGFHANHGRKVIEAAA